MALGNSNLIITIKAEDMASNVIKSVSGSINSLANDIARVAFTNIVNGLEDATLALGKFQMELELTDIAFTQMIKGADRGMHSMEEYTKVAKALRNELHDLAAETPFSFLSVNKAARQLMAYGFAIHDIIPMLRNIGDAAAAFGGSPVVIDRIVRALGQIRTYGRLKGQELLQLTEAGVPAHQILAEELGLTSEQLSRIADQHIPAEDAIKAILTGIQKRYEGMMEVQSRTLKGSIEAIRDNFLLVATQLTETIYSEFSSGIQGFRRNLDQWKNMTRAYGWRGMFGRQVFYDKDNREVNVSKLSKEEIQDKVQKGELRREFDSNRYIDNKGKLADLTGLSQDEIAFKETKGEITKQGPLIPLDWQESIFTFGDYILELRKRLKELGDAFGRLWNTLFGGTDGLSDVGCFIFRMINGFIALTTLLVDVTNSFAKFIDAIFETGSAGRTLQAVLIGVVSAMAMAAAINVVQNFLVLANTFQLVIGYAGMVGMQFGALVGVTYLVAQSNTALATAVFAAGSAYLIYANRAQIAAAANALVSGALRLSTALFGANAIAVAAATIRYNFWRAVLYALYTPILLVNGALAIFNATMVVGRGIAIAVTGTFTALRIAFAVFATAIVGVSSVFGALLAFLNGFSAGVTALTSVISGLRAMFIALAGAANLSRLSMLAHAVVSGVASAAMAVMSGIGTILSGIFTIITADITIVIAAIAALAGAVYLIYNNWNSITQWFGDLWNNIKNIFSDFTNWFVDKLKSFAPSVYNFFVETFTSIGEALSNIWNSIFGNLWENIRTFVHNNLSILEPFVDLLGEIGEKISNAWKATAGESTYLGKTEKFITELFVPRDSSDLSAYPDSYYNVQPVETGVSAKDKKDKSKNQLQQWEKDVSLGEYFAHTSTSINAVGKSFDDMLPALLKATKSFGDFSGTIEDFQKYALTKPGRGINDSIVYNPNDENYALKRGNIILYTGEDGKLHSALYMGDNKIRMGAEEVTKKFVEDITTVASGKMSAKDVTIEPQGAGECTIKSAKAFLGYYDQDNSGLTFSNWASRMRDFVGNNGYDVSNYQEYEQHIKGHFANAGGPVMVYQTGGLGGHELNPNSKHAFVIAGQDEQGNWIVKDPAGGVTKVFHNLQDTWDSSARGSSDVPTGHAIWYVDQPVDVVNANNKLIDWVHSLMPNLSEDIINYTAKTAQEYGVSLAQVFAQMSAESEGNINAKSPVGAIGLMQLMPDTAAGLGVNPYDVYENILGGIKYMKVQSDKFGDTASAIAAYNAGPSAVEKAGGVPNYSETVNYVQKVMTRMKTFPSDIVNVGSSATKVLREVAEVELSSLDSIKSHAVAIIDSDFSGEQMRIEDTLLKEQIKALNRRYKEQEKINKATEDYQKYMLSSKLQLDEINGSFTDYHKKVLEVKAEYHNVLMQAEKLVGQGLSREYAEKMKARAKEVADAVLKEFKRVKNIELNIEFKSNMIKSFELNHKFAQSLSVQKELNRIKWKEDMSTYGREHLQDASKLPDILDKILSGVSVQSLFSRSDSNPYSEWVKSNDTESIKAILSEIIVSLKEIYLEETKLENTTYSRTVESYANQNDLQGFISYNKSDAGKQALITEEAYNANRQWIELLKEDFASLGERINKVMTTAHNSIIENGTSALMDMIKGTKSAKEAFKEFALSVLEDMAKIAIRSALMNAVGNIFSGITGGGKIPWFAEGGHVTKGETILVGEEGPELLSVTRNKSALGNPHTQVVGSYGPEFITVPYSGYIISNNDVSKMFGYYSDSSPMSYIINGFRAQGGDVKKGEAYIVGEKGPEVFSPGQSGSIMSNNQLNSTLNNLERITNAGTMSNPQEGAPATTVPPVVVNLDNKSGHQMEAEATSDFDGEKWVINVVMDAVRRNVNGMRNIIGNVAGKR